MKKSTPNQQNHLGCESSSADVFPTRGSVEPLNADFIADSTTSIQTNIESDFESCNGDEEATYENGATMNSNTVALFAAVTDIDDDEYGDSWAINGAQIYPTIESGSNDNLEFESACGDEVFAEEILHENLASMTLDDVCEDAADRNYNGNDSDSDESISFDLWNNHEELIQVDHKPIDDSDEETFEEIDNNLEFFRSDDVVKVRYRHNEYYVGSLDLTKIEYLKLQQISEINVQLKVDPSYIKIDEHNVFNIVCIEVKEKQAGELDYCDMMKRIKMVRIQFSISEPLLAKYDDKIYVVGVTLYNEYKEIIERTRYPFGTVAIRLYQHRIVCDNQKRTIDVTAPNYYRNKDQICVIGGTFKYDSRFLQKCDKLSGPYSRYVINYMPDMSFEKVDVKLIFSSEHDECCEVYAENDYPFGQIGNAMPPASSMQMQRKPKKEKNLVNNSQDSPAIDFQCMPDIDFQDIPAINFQGSPIIAVDNANDTETNNDYDELEMANLDNYPVPHDIRMLERNDVHWRSVKTHPRYGKFFQKKFCRASQSSYISAFRFMIHLDQEAQKKYLERFDSNVQLTYYMGTKFTFPVTDALSELKGQGLKELDRFILKPLLTTWAQHVEIRGQLCSIKNGKVFIEIYPMHLKAVMRLHQIDTFSIEFQLNPTVYQLQHTALDYIEHHNLYDILISNRLYNTKQFYNPPPKPNAPPIQWAGTQFAALNQEQQITVRNILHKADSLPYILYGPPGTGKTRTIVAAIEQIVRTTKENVLVCTMSNSANDEVAERLANILEPHELYRMYARSHKYSSGISPNLKNISNWDPHVIRLKTLSRLYQYRVICTTLSMAGCFSRAHIDAAVWRPDHFGYVFIDECASSSEPMTLIPIAGVCTSLDTVHAKIILAGDPKQLDSITRSTLAARVGYKRSWLETLYKKSLYKSKRDEPLNPHYISMLVKNYRSHPAILSIPNQLFYKNRLEPSASKGITDWYIGSSILPAKQFPIVFKSIQGRCERSGADSSLFNEQEIEEVVAYVKLLLSPLSHQQGLRKIQDSDIGVVTPYRKQCWKLNYKFKRLRYDGITVGTSEVFQGKEKPVMIVSTVRSGDSLGFVKEERRFNVILTRAKCLLIIIGDPHTLCLDKNWKQFMKHCLDNGGFIQSNIPFRL